MDALTRALKTKIKSRNPYLKQIKVLTVQMWTLMGLAQNATAHNTHLMLKRWLTYVTNHEWSWAQEAPSARAALPTRARQTVSLKRFYLFPEATIPAQNMIICKGGLTHISSLFVFWPNAFLAGVLRSRGSIQDLLLSWKWCRKWAPRQRRFLGSFLFFCKRLSR